MRRNIIVDLSVMFLRQAREHFRLARLARLQASMLRRDATGEPYPDDEWHEHEDGDIITSPMGDDPSELGRGADENSADALDLREIE